MEVKVNKGQEYDRCVLLSEPESSNRQLNRLDRIIMLALVGFALLFALRMVRFDAPPFEDAAMLMRYAVHFAEGHGIVWNIGAQPVDGATDFLFMVMVAGLIRVGLSPEVAVRTLVLVAHLGNVLLIYYTLRRLFGAPWWLSLVPPCFLAVSTGPLYITTCFGAPVFAFFVSLSWFFALHAILRGVSFANIVGFGFFALITGLVRPEGVILSFLMTLAVLFVRGWRDSVPLLVGWVLFVIVLGGAYFLWRWHYFGYPLPNPFYKKGGGVLYLSGLYFSYKNLVAFSLPFLLLYFGGLFDKSIRRLVVGLLIPSIGFITAFIMLSNEMNFAGRFQYPVLPLILMGIYPAAQAFWRQLQLERCQGMLRSAHIYLLFATLAMLFMYNWLIFYRRIHFPLHHGLLSVAKSLAQFRSQGYWMAVSEAGILPYYSGWNTIDTWGLNDQWIAHNGRITEEYLEQHRPHIIMFHAYFSPITPVNHERLTSRDTLVRKWDEMLDTLKRYAESRGYILAAVYGETPYDTHYYYVRPDFPDAQKIISIIRQTPYKWYASNAECVNYALLEPKSEETFGIQ